MSVVAPPTPALAVQSATIVVFNALDAANRPVARAAVTVGVTPWDDCCMGELYGRIDRTYRSDRFPTEGAMQVCAHPTAAQIVIGLVRCYPTLDEGGRAPSPQDETQAALALYSDALIVWETLQNEPWWSEAVLVESQGFLSLGGCAAVETTAYVELV